MNVKVEVYSSFGYAVEPRAFEYDGPSTMHRETLGDDGGDSAPLRMTRRRVVEITRSWRTPGLIHFYVRVEGGEFFQLSWDEAKDEWVVRAFGKTCPPRKLEL